MVRQLIFLSICLFAEGLLYPNHIGNLRKIVTHRSRNPNTSSNDLSIVNPKPFSIPIKKRFNAENANNHQTTTATTATISDEKTKVERFVKWMTSDSRDEIHHPGKRLDIIGTIPSFLRGSYIKNGPAVFKTQQQGQQQQQQRRYTHAFDGLAKLIKFDFFPNDDDDTTAPSKTSVKFTAKFIDSRWKKQMLEHDVIPPHISVGPVEPPLNPLEKIIAAVTSSPLFDNVPVNIHNLGCSSPSSSSSDDDDDDDDEKDMFVAVTDAPVMISFHRKTLDTVGKVIFDSPFRGMTLGGFPLFSTAHPVCWNGGTYNYFLELNPTGTYAHLARCEGMMTGGDADDGSAATAMVRRTSVGRVSLEGKINYVHSFSVTEEGYAVLIIYPLHLPFKALLEGTFLPELEFDAGAMAKIHVFDLNEARDINDDGITARPPLATFDTPAFFAYHHVNAFTEDDGTTIVVDVVAYEDASIAISPHGFLYMDNMKSEEGRRMQVRDGNVWRFRLGLAAELSTEKGTVSTRRVVTPQKTSIVHPVTGYQYSFELVTISPHVKGKKYRYCYGFTGFHEGETDFMDWAIVKQDMDDDDGHKIWHEEFCYPGEPTFVPNNVAKEEDDGVLLSSVYDSRREENFLLVLDAKSMKEVARAYTGMAMPSGFHGDFFPRD